MSKNTLPPPLPELATRSAQRKSIRQTINIMGKSSSLNELCSPTCSTTSIAAIAAKLGINSRSDKNIRTNLTLEPTYGDKTLSISMRRLLRRRKRK